jgi:hypothetical protein
MAYGLAKWFEFTPEQEREARRLDEEERVQRLRALTETESIRMYFELLDMGRPLRPATHVLPVAPARIIG